MKKIYIASSWRNATFCRDFASELRFSGFEVYNFSDYHSVNFVWTDIASAEVLATLDAKSILANSKTRGAYELDKRALDTSEVVLMVMPCGKSAHLEASFVKGRGGKFYIFAPQGFEKGEFENLYHLADGMFDYYQLLDLKSQLRRDLEL